MSHITLTGRLTADAELRFTPSGHAQLTFTVADNHRKKNGNDWEDDGASFWRITLWRNDAETYVELLTKGTEVIVTGEPRIREFETRDGGKGKSAEVAFPIVGIRHRAPRTNNTPTTRTSTTTQQDVDPWATPGTDTSYSDTPPF